MAETPATERERLFNIYSRHVTLWEPDKRDIFFCPLCLRAFNRLALEGDNPAVNLAHVIPASLGGRFCTLTCSDCNSRGGTDLEAALAERFDAEDVAAGVGRVRGHMSGPFGDIGVEWQMSPDRKDHSIYCVPEQTNPADLGALHRYMDEQTSRPHANVEFSITPDYDHQPAQVEAAVYQSAFLLMFSYFGYEFVCNPLYASLREQVLRPDEKIWKSQIKVMIEETAQAILGGHRQAVVFNSDPPAILAILRFRRKKGRKKGIERVFAIVLPGLDGPSPGNPTKVSKDSMIIRYRPEALLNQKFYFLRLWRFVRQRLANASSDGK